MAKKSKFRPGVRTREGVPLYRRNKDGSTVLLCPFCTPTHPLVPGKSDTCGTQLRVTAVQQVISSRTARQQKLVCVKCGETGHGEMVQYFNGFLHAEECNPEVQLLTDIPKFSKWAERVYKLPENLRAMIEKHTGVVQVVNGMTPEGEETGQVEGYFFRKLVQDG